MGAVRAISTEGQQRRVARKGRPSAPERKVRIDAVLEAAREEFSSAGFHDAKMDSVAARAAVSKRSLYLWYANKADLFRACVLDAATATVLPPLDHGTGFEASLDAFAEAMLSEIATDYGLRIGRLLILEGRHFPEIAHSIALANEVFTAPVREVLVQRGLAINVAATLADLFVSMVLMRVQQEILLRIPLPPADELRELRKLTVQLFIDGIAMLEPANPALLSV